MRPKPGESVLGLVSARSSVSSEAFVGEGRLLMALQKTPKYLVDLDVLRCVEMRWLCHLFLTQLHPRGGYRIDPKAAVTCQIHQEPI